MNGVCNRLVNKGWVKGLHGFGGSLYLHMGRSMLENCGKTFAIVDNCEQYKSEQGQKHDEEGSRRGK